MNTLKRKNMEKAYTGFHGSRTMDAIEAQIPAELKKKLTGRELGEVMNAINTAYHAGRASRGATDLENGHAAAIG